jgi:effector-binding domain-containing protein
VVDAGIERRGELRYCALPATLQGADVPRQIREAYQALDGYLGERGIEDRGPSIIRYRRSSLDGPLEVEIGWIIEDLARIEPPFVVDTLPEGDYVVGWHNGPYAQVGETTRELIAWGDDRSVTWDLEPDDRGGRWNSWFELYLSEPSLGPQGPTGSIEICVRVRDADAGDLRSG